MNVTISVSARALRLGLVLAVAAAGLVVVPAIVWASHAFTDVAAGNVHHDAVDAIADAGVTQGCAEGRYCPGDAVRRDQMASFMDRLGALSGQEPVVNAATAEQADSAGQAANSAALGGTAAQELLDRLDSVEGDLAAASARIDALETDNADLQSTVGALEATLAGVARSEVDGRDTLRLDGMNLQLVNGTDTTDGEPNGLGNLIIGYNAPHSGTDPAVDRAGSHYLVVGDRHHWTRFGGLIAGLANSASGDWASVTGGVGNSASGLLASVTGGQANSASGDLASVTGGAFNTASGTEASVTGGENNTAGGESASVTGGQVNTASGGGASVTGGSSNTASGSRASVTGGSANTANDSLASVTGGAVNTASGSNASILGGNGNTVGTDFACHPGC